MTVSDVATIINQVLPEPQSGLLAGMIFGTKSHIEGTLYDALVTTGTLHIVALSGANISILIACVNALFLFFLRRPIANILSCGIIIGFVWFVGPSPSVIRAAIMGLLALLAVSLGRQYGVLLSWMLAVSLMLVVNPAWLADLSFQLSVMATLGIILFGSEPEKGFRRRSFFESGKDALIADLRVTLAAQVFTVPIILFAFGRISLVSPLTNLLIGWLIAPIMALGLLLVVLGFLWMPLAHPVAWVVWVPLTVLVKTIELTARIPFASIAF